jgi:flagellar motor switch protein FliM
MAAVGDILSQEEIAALLRDATSGATGAVVAPFDFAADDHRVRRLLPLFEPIARNFARRLQDTLSTALRQPVAIAVRPAVSHASGAAAVTALGAVSIVCLESVDATGRLWIAVDASWIGLMVDAYYGGVGRPSAGHDHAASPAAAWMQRRLMSWIQSDLQAVWPPAHPLAFVPVEEGQGNRGFSIGEEARQVVLQPFSLRLGGQEMELALVIPLSILDGLPVSEMPRHTARQKEWQHDLACALREVPMTLTARLAEIHLTMGELLALRSGDILPLEEPDRVGLYFEDRPLTDGALGTTGGRKVVRLEQDAGHRDDPNRGEKH